MKKLSICVSVMLGAAYLAYSAEPAITIPIIRVVRTLADSGANSLRQHIADAGRGDVIIFDSALNGGTITLTSGQILIDETIRISGPGAGSITIGGNNPGA